VAVALAGCSSHLAAISAAGRVHVWAHGSADCLLTLSIAPESVVYPCLAGYAAAHGAGVGEARAGALLLLLALQAGRTVTVVTRPLEEGRPGEGLVGAVPLAVCAAGAHGPTLRFPGLAQGLPAPPPAEAAVRQGPARPTAASQSLSGFLLEESQSQRSEAITPDKPGFIY